MGILYLVFFNLWIGAGHPEWQGERAGVQIAVGAMLLHVVVRLCVLRDHVNGSGRHCNIAITINSTQQQTQHNNKTQQQQTENIINNNNANLVNVRHVHSVPTTQP